MIMEKLYQPLKVVQEVELLKQLSLHQEHQITLKEALFVIPMK